MAFSCEPFKDAIVSPAGNSERGNLGSMPNTPTSGKTEESYAGVTPKPLPINDLHLGTPDSGPGKY